MKKLVILLSTLVLSFSAFAGTTVLSLSNKQNVQSLVSLLKSPQSVHLNKSNEVAIVYGGEDISRNINSMSSRAFA